MSETTSNGPRLSITAPNAAASFESALAAAEDHRIRWALLFARHAGLWPREMIGLRHNDASSGTLSVADRGKIRGVPVRKQVAGIFNGSDDYLFASVRYAYGPPHIGARTLSDLVARYLFRQAPGMTMLALRNEYLSEVREPKAVDTRPRTKVSPLVESWLAELASLGYSEHTCRLRRWQLSKWEQHLDGRDLNSATREDVVALTAMRRSDSHRRALRTAIDRFYEWGRATGQLSADPSIYLPKPRVEQGIPKPMPDDLFNSAYVAADKRTRQILLLARFAGLRVSEIARVRTTDLVDGSLFVLGKGGRAAAIPAHPRIVAMLKECDAGWLFPSPVSTTRNEFMLGASIGAIGNRHLAEHAPGWTMHKLRHAFATELIRSTHDLLLTQKAMRHASPSTTAGYALLDDAFLRSAVAALHASSSTMRTH